jgi:hypothetical protein
LGEPSANRPLSPSPCNKSESWRRRKKKKKKKKNMMTMRTNMVMANGGGELGDEAEARAESKGEGNGARERESSKRGAAFAMYCGATLAQSRRVLSGASGAEGERTMIASICL